MTAPTVDTRNLQRPLPSEIDVFGLTDCGRVRQTNADHFLVASLHRVMKIHSTSLGDGKLPPLESDVRGYFILVADGVGGLSTAGDGSALAIQTIAQYILFSSEDAASRNPAREKELVAQLRKSVMRGHKVLRTLSDEHPVGGTTTTLTMLTVVWPRAYVVHAGDSRCYRVRRGELHRLTTDQTMAEVMVQAGAMSEEAAAASRLSHVLWSALGSTEVAPELYVTDCERTDVILLCTDGLTRHVTEDEIRQRLGANESAETTARSLVDLALERGGVDNVTVVVGRIRNP